MERKQSHLIGRRSRAYQDVQRQKECDFPPTSEVKFPETQNYWKGQYRAQNFRPVWYGENFKVTQLLIMLLMLLILSFYEVSPSQKISTSNSRLVSIVGNKFVCTHCVSHSLQRCASMKGNKDIAFILCDCFTVY